MQKDLYIIFGPPGSGKTAIADFMARTLRLNHISWGSIYRDKVKGSEYKELFRIIEDEKTTDLLRSEKIARIIELEIEALHECETGLVLEGFPKRLEEAKILTRICKKYGYNIKALIRINPSIENAFERFNRGMFCKACGRYYDDHLNSPKIPGKCDFDGNDLIRCDKSMQSIKRDFLFYVQESYPAFDHLKRNADSYFDVTGEDQEIVIFSRILLKLRDKEKNDYQIFKRQSSSQLETKYGFFEMITYQSKIDYSYCLALVKGKINGGKVVPLRVHSSCITGDIFGSLRCDCGEQLHKSMEFINEYGSGIVIYLFQEGRGINIINKVRAYELQDNGFDTVQANEKIGFPAELREYLPVRDVLKDLGVKTVSLLTNNPDKVKKLTDLGIVIQERRNVEVEPGIYNSKYLRTKKVKMGHMLNNVEEK